MSAVLEGAGKGGVRLGGVHSWSQMWSQGGLAGLTVIWAKCFALQTKSPLLGMGHLGPVLSALSSVGGRKLPGWGAGRPEREVCL